MKCLITIIMLLIFSILCYGQETGGYTLFFGEFENKTDIVNPLLDLLADTLSYAFSRSEQVKIHTISPGLRSAYLQRAYNEQPDADATQIALRAAEYAKADVLLVGSYSKTDAQWTMEAQLYVMREGTRARENIQFSADSMYRLLDSLAAEVGKKLGAGQYMLLSTKSWEAYEAYRQGHLAYYNFDLMGAIGHFQRAVELDPRLAVAQAELGISYAMMSMLDQASAAFVEASRNLQYASEHEKLVVMGLESFYRYYWIMKSGGMSQADMPRMREDRVWDEPWLSWYIGETSGDEAVRNRAYEQWLVSATVYAKAGFYGVDELAYAGTGKCLDAFSANKDPQFLDAALQFAAQAADSEANDEYDDTWKHWELADIYEEMGRTGDVQKHREQWLQVVRDKQISSFPPDKLNDFASGCLTMGKPKAALEFAAKAVELAPNLDNRMLYFVTLADARLAAGELTEAFSAYSEAFQVSTRGDASTRVLANSLSGLAKLLRSHSGFVGEDKQAKLNEIINAIGDMDPLIFRAYDAHSVLHLGGTTLEGMWHFCHAMGDMGPMSEIIRSLLREEPTPAGQLVYLADLIMLNGGVGESERNWLSSPEFIQSIADLNSPIGLGWVYEMIGEPTKAVEAYEAALKSELPAARMVASCALVSLRHSLGEETASQPHVYLEAEEAESFTPYFEIAEAPEASGGRYLWVPDTFNGSHDGKGQAEYEFEIPQAGTYLLVARMLAEELYAESTQASIGGSEADLGIKSGRAYRNQVSAKDIPIAIELSELGQARQTTRFAAWEWVPAGKSFTLPAGKHRLVVHNKDDGVKLDCMVLYREN